MADHAELEQAGGEIFLDARGHGRAMRLSWHPESDIVVLSLWRGEVCAGTFRMPHADVAAFVDALVDGLRDVPGLLLASESHPDSIAPAASQAPDPHASPTPSRLDETQLVPTQAVAPPVAAPSFIEWAFGHGDHDERASAS